MNIRIRCFLCYALTLPLLNARSAGLSCGTYSGNGYETLDVHQRFERRLAGRPKAARAASATPRLDADIGNIAVLESDDSIIGRANEFNLDRTQVTFTPNGATYSYQTASGGFDQVAAGSASPLSGLGDDDTRRFDLPFPFRYYGETYRELWVNSDGNVTFLIGDNASQARTLGRMAGGPPRISPFFADLDPSIARDSVRVTSTPDSFTVTWLRVPEYSDLGNGVPQTAQLKLFPDGRITLSWDGAAPTDGAVVGISPGETKTRALLTSFKTNPTGSSASMIAERFGAATEIDLVAAARRFYENHDDAYDYLAFFNTTNSAAGTGAVAVEYSVRTSRLGIGDTAIDIAREYGSPNRLQAVLNMGPLNTYPSDPNSLHPLRASAGDTGLTVIAHEIGHLFLAYSSIRDPNNPAARPMLGNQLFHWNFRFNSEASLLEGNRIRDNGPNANPRFLTTATAEGYSPLDQYLMGLRPATEVPPTFLVENATTNLIFPRVGVSFNGTRRDISVDDLIAVDGRRIPDHTVEQRRYRIAFILITPAGQSATASDLALLERYRAALESTFPKYTSNRATMDATLRRAVRFSIEPAAGAVAGSNVAISVALQKAAATPVTVPFTLTNGLLEGPASVTIAAGSQSATANFRALRAGVETLRAEPADSTYMVTEARLNIAPAIGALQLRILVGDRQIATPGQPLATPIVVKLTDENDLPYAGYRLVATGGTVSPASQLTGPDGRATFQWTPGSEPLQVIRFTVQGEPLPFVEATAVGRPSFSAGAVVNAASFLPGVTPGGIATIFGANLGRPQVTVEGTAAQVFFANDRQINFAVPNLTATAASVSIAVRTSLGTATASVPLLAVQPGIFFDPSSGRAAAIDRGSRIFELYGTGFGSATVTAQAGGRPAEVLFNGLAPGFVGLQQINIRVDAGVPSGEQPAVLTAGGVASNQVKLLITP